MKIIQVLNQKQKLLNQVFGIIQMIDILTIYIFLL